MDPLFLADVIAITHLGIVLFVIFGQLAVMLGWCLRWDWVRRPAFRVAHGIVILTVVVQSLFGKLCFLTTWESSLRRSAGQPEEGISFVARLVRRLLFVEDVDQNILNRCYYAFGALVLFSWIKFPPKRGSAGHSPP